MHSAAEPAWWRNRAHSQSLLANLLLQFYDEWVPSLYGDAWRRSSRSLAAGVELNVRKDSRFENTRVVRANADADIHGIM